MRRSISPLTLLFASVSAILGSGWLFASFYTARLAGPSVILAWILGGFAVVVIAFVFAELCALLPVTGSSTRIPQYTHGVFVSFLFSWFI
jgi:amino acid transporter